MAIDVGESDFQQRVVEASRETPVIVDFWAAWCQPCRVLGPMLERLAEEYSGRFVLAKIDVDSNPGLAQAFGVQGIPAVKAFRDGAVVSEFVGVQPEDVIRRFLDDAAPGEDLVGPARRAAERGDLDEAERGFHDALEARQDDEAALGGLAKVMLERGDEDEARRLIAGRAPHGEVGVVAAELELRAAAAGSGETAAAASDAVAGDHLGALQRLLKLVVADEDREGARGAMVAVFRVLGEEHPLTREFRPKLASALF